MRAKGLIPESGNTKNRVPKSVAPEVVLTPAVSSGASARTFEKTNEVQSFPAFDDVRMSVEQENDVYIELVEFLNDKYFPQLAILALDYIQD